MNQINESLRPVASFIVENTTDLLMKLAFFTGHYATTKIALDAEKNPYLLNVDPKALVAAGYQCDQVADDFVAAVASEFPIKVSGKSPRTRMVDLGNYVRNSNLRVVKIRITDLTSESNHELFNHEIEVSASSISSKGLSDYIQMSTYVNPRNYQQNVIEIDLEENNLTLDETTVMIMDVVAKAKFQIDFIIG